MAGLRFVVFAILVSGVLFTGCTWSREHLSETVQFFNDHRAALEAAVAEVRKGGDYETLRKRYLRLAPEGFEHSTSPFNR